MQQILFEEAGKLDIKVSLSIEVLAHIVNKNKEYNPKIKRDKIKPDTVKKLIEEIADKSWYNNVKILINEEAYDDEYI